MKKRHFFPDPRGAGPEGLVSVSQDLSVNRLLEAYSFGIFPWPHEDYPLMWFCPPERGVLFFKDLHISKSLKAIIKKTEWTLSANKAFEEVITSCSWQKRPGQEGTWINREIIKAYLNFHEAGFAHSIECWDRKKLVGGLYGVFVGGTFAGESMFFHQSGASQIALLAAIQFLSLQGKSWMDCQMVSPHLQTMGATYVTRNKFLKMIEKNQEEAVSIDFRNLGLPKVCDMLSPLLYQK